MFDNTHVLTRLCIAYHQNACCSLGVEKQIKQTNHHLRVILPLMIRFRCIIIRYLPSEARKEKTDELSLLKYLRKIYFLYIDMKTCCEHYAIQK